MSIQRLLFITGKNKTEAEIQSCNDGAITRCFVNFFYRIKRISRLSFMLEALRKAEN